MKSCATSLLKGAAFLALGCVISCVAAIEKERPLAGPHQSCTITLDQIGTSAKANSPGASVYRVGDEEEVSGSIDGQCPSRGTLQIAVRRSDDRAWTIQKSYVALRALNSTHWSVSDVRFGSPSDTTAEFELKAVLSRNLLPSGTTPGDLLSRSVLAASPVISAIKPDVITLRVTHVASKPVFGDDLYDVSDESKIRVASSHLPKGVLIGISVEPVLPERTKDGSHWVMDNTIDHAQGQIAAAFGEPCHHQFYQYELSAFAAFPGPDGIFGARSRQLGSREWETYRQSFLAQSRVINVIKWQREFEILKIGETAIVHSLSCEQASKARRGEQLASTERGEESVSIPRTADVEGSLEKPLEGQEIHLIGIPDSGDPWLAGITGSSLPGGKWVVHMAAFDGATRQRRPFRLLAVISDDVPGKWDSAEVARWVNEHHRDVSQSVRVRVTDSGARE